LKVIYKIKLEEECAYTRVVQKVLSFVQ